MRPNIVLIVMDAARADRLSCYGYSRKTTPNLDALAARGYRFDQAISAGCWTVPSHASLFTGLYPIEHGANQSMLPESAGTTIAERLQNAGYQTIAISANPYISPGRGFGRGFAEFHEVWRSRPRLRRGQVIPWLGRRLGWLDNGARETNAIVRRKLATARRPFFIFINYMETHSPYLRFWPVGREFIRPSLNLSARLRLWRYHRQAREWDQFVEGGETLMQLLGDLYDEDMHYVDRRVGDLLNDFDRAGLMDSTVTVVTADHGENMGEHGLVQHHLCLYDTLLRVPLLVCAPDVAEGGTCLSNQVQLTDLAPSLARFAGINSGGSSEERPYLLDARKMVGRDWPAYAQYDVPPEVMKVWSLRNRRFDFHPYNRSLRAIRDGGLKYIQSEEEAVELYDLCSDPGETKNLAGDESRTAEVKKMAAELDDWLRQHKPIASEGELSEDPAVERKLRELGYL